MKCKKDCKWIGYDYSIDKSGQIIGAIQYKCEKYDTALGHTFNRCTECLQNDNIKPWKKDKFYNK